MLPKLLPFIHALLGNVLRWSLPVSRQVVLAPNRL